MENPFKYGGIVQGPYFADRERELAELVREMTNLNRVFLLVKALINSQIPLCDTG